MVDITSVLSLQGRARRNAKASMRRLRRERDDAAEASAALHRAASTDPEGAPAREGGASPA